MEKFLSLKLDENVKVPKIAQLLKSVGPSPNDSFYQISNLLHFKNNLNSNYTLVSLKEIIDISPINISSDIDENLVNPINSYRWLFLIHAIASKTISNDEELEKGKIEYVLKSYADFIIKCDNETLKKKNVLPLLCGVFCVSARLIEACKYVPEYLKSAKLIEMILNILKIETSGVPKCIVGICDFSVSDIFSLCSPVSLEYVSPTDVFSNLKLMLSASILRFLNCVLPSMKFDNQIVLNSYKENIQQLCVKGIVSNLAIKVLIHLFKGDKDEAFKYTDTIEYQQGTELLLEKANKTKRFKYPLNYDESIKLSEDLSHIKSVALAHPKHWISFLQNNTIMIDLLLTLLQSDYDPDFVIASATILRIGEAKLNDLSSSLNLLICSRSMELRKEISKLLFLQPQDSVTEEILKCFSLVCNYGSRSSVFFEFLAEFLSKINTDKKIDIIKALIKSIYYETDEIKKLPNSHIYTQLSQFIDVPASYLDPQPCTVCNNPERQPAKKDLFEFKDYFKYTHDKIFVKLKQPHIIQTFTLSLNIKKKSRLPRTVHIYVSSSEISNQNDLIGEKMKWYHAGDLNFPKDTTVSTVDLPLRLFATCIQFHFAEFWEDSLAGMLLICPICRSEITDRRSGLCPKCKENAYQCRECRNINYSHLDSFICCECGYSNFVNFNWTITAFPSFSHTHILTENDCINSLKKCDDLLAEAHSVYEVLTKLKNEIDVVLSPACTLSLNNRTSKLNNLYNSECKGKFQSLASIVQHVCAIRAAVASFKKKSAHSFLSSSINMCYNCRSTYIKNCLKFFNAIPEVIKIFHDYLSNNNENNDENLSIPNLLFSFANENSIFTSTAIDSLVAFCSSDWVLTLKIVDIFTKSLPNVSPQLVRLLCELENVKDQQRGNRLTIFLTAMKSVIKFMNYNSSFTPTVIQPLFNAIASSSLIIRSPSTYLMNKAYYAWQKFKSEDVKEKLFDPLELILSQEFCTTLFIQCSSDSVRNSIASLYKDASKFDEKHFKAICNTILSIIETKSKFDQYDMQLYQVLAFLLEENNAFQIYTLQTPFFDHIVDLLCKEVDDVLANEECVTLNLNIGLQASILMDVVDIYLRPIVNLRYIIIRKTESIIRIFTSYFKLRSLLIQRSKYLDNCMSMMKDMIVTAMLKEFDLNYIEKEHIQQDIIPSSSTDDINSLPEEDYYSGDDDEEEELEIAMENVPPPNQDSSLLVPNNLGPTILLRAAINSIEFCPEIVIREVASVMFPPKQTTDVPILLQKQASHEIYIPGRLPNHPINSNHIGETFRDIKIKICTDLNISHLIEDDHGMELLVDRNIIGLSLPIKEVFERIWVPNHGRKPMLVVCRLQGLDGEATEPMIESFPHEETDDDPPEKKYAYTSMLSENNGLNQFVIALKDRNEIVLSDVALKDLILLFEAFSHVPANRNALIKLGFIDIAFEYMAQIVDDEGPPEQMYHIISIVSLLLNNLSSNENSKYVIQNPEQKIKFIFDSLNTNLLRNNSETLLSPFLSLIAPLAEGSHPLAITVVSRFLDQLRPSQEPIKETDSSQSNNQLPSKQNESLSQNQQGEDKPVFNFFANAPSLFMLNSFAEFALALPSGDGEIRDLILREKVVDDALVYLEQLFPLAEGKNSQKWNISLKVPCLPMLLKFLAGMVRNHKPTQELFSENNSLILKLLIELESVTSEASIGEFATQLLVSASSEDSILAETINKIRKENTELIKQRASEEKKKALLAAQQHQISPDIMKMMDELSDQTWECCICKEGYESEPKELLGIYVYSNRIAENQINTATYFVCVHPSCHNRDTKANDRHSRLREWDAAMVRNCERPCNSIFPLPYHSISQSQYKSALTHFFNEVRGRGSPDYFKMCFFDVKMHLETISKDEKIPLTMGGGSQSSIFELIPFLIYAGHLYLDGDARHTKEMRLQHLIIENPEENPIDALVLSLWILSIEEWNEVKLLIFKSLLKTLPMKDESNTKKASNEGPSNENKNSHTSFENETQLFSKLKSAFILYIIICKLHPMLKEPSGIAPSKNDNVFIVRDHREEKWIHSFYDKITQHGFEIVNQFLDFAGEVEDEIVEIPNLKTAISYLDIPEANNDPYSWVKSVISI